MRGCLMHLRPTFTFALAIAAWEGKNLYVHMRFYVSECLHIGLVLPLPVWMRLRLTGGCEAVCLCLFMCLHSGCLLVWAAFPSTYVSVATCLIA